MPLRYHERTVPFTGDPLEALTRVAESSGPGDFVVYEGCDSWSLGCGALAEITLDRSGARSTVAGRTAGVLPPDGDPLEAVRHLLAALPVRGWRAYGWSAFELAYLKDGKSDGVGDERLLHLMVPKAEIRIARRQAALRAAEPAVLDALYTALLDALRAEGSPRRRAPTPADVRGTGAREYKRAVALAVEHIRARRFDKVVLSRTVPVPHPVDFTATYLAGRRANTPARSFLLRLDGVRSAGFSPEVVVCVGPDGTVMSQPLAGTRARTDDPAENDRLRAELISDPKEVYEHAISVRTACEELSQVCAETSVAVEEFMRVRERGSVQHLGSKVTGRLAGGRGAWDVFGAVFPAVTASGIPKTPANSWIHAGEDRARGLYGGAVLTVDEDGALDAALVLRAVYQRGGRTWLQAGAGIVGDSRPDREFEETCEKLDSVARFLVRAEPGTDDATARPGAADAAS
ncbi:salicylate synthase [Streptomyces fungicidicus]|uniref:salicylate synthase n=1 Tax=Streptomyces fungicidicus TaxID=68203 RepID=UPI00368DF878